MHAGAISKLLCGLCVCTGDNPLAKACGLSSPAHTQKPYNNLHLTNLKRIKYFYTQD